MKNFFILITALILSGCATSGYQQFYNESVDTTTLPNPILLKDGEDPEILGSNDLERDIQTLRAKRYAVIGSSSFNGSFEKENNVAEQARRVGATLVLIQSEYTNTQTTTSTLYMPSTNTAYTTGKATSSTNLNTNTGIYGTANTNTNYNQTTTFQGSKAIPITRHQRRFDQTAVYLVKIDPKVRLGVFFLDLPSELRNSLERNTGAYIDLVYEESPAFFADILKGDVLIEIGDQKVMNGIHAGELISSIPQETKETYFKIIRKGNTITIQVNL